MFSNRASSIGWLRRLAGFLAVLALFCCSTDSLAIAPTKLPVFYVQGLDGSQVSSANWELKGKSLLIYVRADCRACTALLDHLSKRDYPGLARHIMIIVSGTGAEGAKSWRQRFPDLDEATWYADPSKATATALHLKGAPMILGLQDNVVKWALSGEMQKAAQQKSVLNTWCKQATTQPVGK